MRLGITALVLMSQFLGLPALAAPLNLDDEHLYLRHSEEFFTVYHYGRPGRWRWHRPWISEYAQERTVITKGEIPIGEERFVHLIDRSKADPSFVQEVRQEESARSRWSWATLGSFVTFGVGLSLLDGPQSAGQPLANSLAIAGLCGSLISSAVWTAHLSRPLFTEEEAAEAIKAYNRQLDRR